MEERYNQAKKLFLEVCDLSPEERQPVLDRQCAGDAALRAEVESLLKHHDDPPTGTVPAPPAAGDDSSDREPGRHPQHIGPYRVVRQIGRGGMGVVYLGVREGDRLKQRAAIKVLKRGMDTREILNRFEQERQVLAALNHPAIARLYDAGETEGLPYFAMEYVEGQPIDDYCDTHRLRIAERLELFQQVCSAVHYVHQNLMVHRDLKPSNILITGEGQPKLLDFGIAKLVNPGISLFSGDPTAPEMRIMTPEYASPEQIRDNPITVASDIYSLGVILFELVTGHRPYRIKSRVRAEIAKVICEVDPERPSTAISVVEVIAPEEHDSGMSTTITPELVAKCREGRPDRLRRRLAGDIDNIVLMALRKEPQRRYESAQQFAQDIRRHLEGLPVAARRDTSGYRFAKFVRRHRRGVAAAAAVVVALLGWGVTAARGWSAAADHVTVVESERDRTRRMLDEVFGLTDAFFKFHDTIAHLDGTLTARMLLAKTAQECLDRLRPDEGDDPRLLRKLATAYDKVGDIWGGHRGESLGETANAMANFRTAMGMRQSLLAAHPTDLELRRDLAVSHTHVGDVLRITGNVNGALQAYGAACEIAEELAKADPRFRRFLAIALTNHGAAFKDTGRLEEARHKYERSLMERQRFLAELPNDSDALRDVGTGHVHFGEALELMGDYERALGEYLESIEVRREMARRNPDSGRDRRYLALAQHFAANMLLKLDRPEQAAGYVEACAAILEQRDEDNPTSARAQRDLAMSHEIRGRLQAALGDPAAALRSYQLCQSIVRRLADEDPDNMHDRELVAESQERIAEAHALLGDRPDAEWAYRQALDTISPVALRDPDDVDVKLHRARVLSALGGVLTETGVLQEAQSRLEEARLVQESILKERPSNARALEGLVLTLRRLANAASQRGYAAEALAFAQGALDVLSGSTGPAAAALREAIKSDLASYRGSVPGP